jgi:hypothetical protein
MALGQTAYTTPVGYTTQTLGAGKFSFVGLTVHNAVVSAGVIDAEAAGPNSVTDTGVDFSTLLTAGSTYVLELEDGTVQEVTSWTAAGVLNTPEDITSKVSPGVTTYKLRKASTINDVFGATNSAGLKSTDSDIQSADVIYLVGAGGAVTPVYYYDDGSEATWYTADGDPAGNLPIVYGDGFYVGRVAGSPINLVVSGEVKTEATSGVITPGWNFLSSVAPTGMTLGTSGLKDFLTPTDSDYLTVDNVYIPNADGSFTIAYYYDDGSEATWYTAEGEPAADLALEGGLLVFSRSASAKGYTLSVPTSYSSL